MDHMQAWPLLGGFFIGALLAAGAIFVWLSRRVQLERQRALQFEQAHQQVVQQVMLARKQIEQLQRECQELRQGLRPAPRQSPAPVPAQEPVDEKPQAFKDTVVLPHAGG